MKYSMERSAITEARWQRKSIEYSKNGETDKVHGMRLASLAKAKM